jgi:hypothetical protein
MKKALVLVSVLLCGAGAHAADKSDNSSVVNWRTIVGVITAPDIDNPVAVVTNQQGTVVTKISAGTLPWTARDGSARVDLISGAVEFSVRGLVLVGGNASGTSPINQVTGTLVCNPGSTDNAQPQTILDTPPVALSALGDARFSGELTAPVPFHCTNPLFLVRIGPAFGPFAGRWLATGVEPRQGDARGADREDGGRH